MLKRIALKSLSLGKFSCTMTRGMRLFASRSSFLPTDFLTSNESDRANRCADFIDSSPDPFHCVQTVKSQLDSKGFRELDEKHMWSSSQALQPGGKYYFTRYGSSIVAFTIGKQYKSGNGFKIMGAHTDSPNLRIKPNSKKITENAGVVQVNVEPYGGGLWNTWFDRDLSLSGRVIVRRKSESVNTTPTNNSLEVQLVKINLPILRIPNLCIHLQCVEERATSMKLNKEDHLVPILTQYVQKQENQLLRLLAETCMCSVEDIADFELSLYDVQKAARTGLCGEFLASSRLDNLASCFVLAEALVDHSEQGLEHDEGVCIMALFDHEEVGSDSHVGAGSTLISDAITRILECGIHTNHHMPRPLSHELVMTSKAKSYILSMDMAHAIHANYMHKHSKEHAPIMNQGVVIKHNRNQKYATDSMTAFMLREMAKRVEDNGAYGGDAVVPIQEYMVRNDCPCGSTIGPTLSTNLGIRAIDVGMSMLAMHSVREVMGCKDLTYTYTLVRKYLRTFEKIDKELTY